MKKLLLILLCLPIIGFGQTWEIEYLSNGYDLNTVYFYNDTIGYAVGDNGAMIKTIDALGDTIQSGNISWFVTFASDTSWYSYMISSPIIPVYPLSIYFVYSNLTGSNPGDYTCILTYNISPTNISDINVGGNRKLQKTVDILGKETKPQTNTPLIEIYDDGTVEKRIVIE